MAEKTVEKKELLPRWMKDTGLLLFIGGFMITSSSKIATNAANIENFNGKADQIIEQLKDLKKSQEDLGRDVQGYHSESLNAICDLKVELEDAKNNTEYNRQKIK